LKVKPAKVYLRNTTRRYRIDLRGLQRAARVIVRAVAGPQATLSLSLVGDVAIRRLNRDYRGKDAPTDVLSFSLDGCSQLRRSSAEKLLGDVVMSVDTARRQASGYGASLDAELRRLLIHGVLHLVGHDHERPGERARMEAAERRLAARIGLPWPNEKDAHRGARGHRGRRRSAQAP
jgi:probable rRNA maturation factor